MFYDENTPDTIISVGAGAFSGCTSLVGIDVYAVEGNTGEKFYSSHDGALIFYDAPSACYYLEVFPRAKTGSYTVPDIVDVIRPNAFMHSNIEHIVVSRDVSYIAARAFNDCRGLKSLTFEYGGTLPLIIEDGAFANCTILEFVTLPARVAEFNYRQLAGCTALKSINVEADAEHYASTKGMLTNGIGNEILLCPPSYNQTISFPVGINAIGERAFENLLLTGEIVIPAYINSIGKHAFAGCAYITGVVVEGGRNKPLTIAEGAFANCASLASITFSGNTSGKLDAGAVTIGKLAFSNNKSLTTLTVKAGANIQQIGESAFAFNAALEELCFEDGAAISSIGAYAFQNATALKELVIHSSTAEVGNHAFSGCALLASLSFAPNGKEINLGDSVFSGCSRLTQVLLPANVEKLQSSAFDGCDSIREIIVDPANKHLKSLDGVLYDYDLKVIKFYPRAKDGDLSQLPWDTLTHIEGAVFRNNPKITAVKIGAKMVEIGASAFENCINLSSVTFDNGISGLSIGTSAFENCVALNEINLPAGTVAIGEKAFYMTELRSLVIPSSVTTIGDHAFAYTKISSVRLTSSLSSVGNGAFAFCTQLVNVTIEATGSPLTLGTADNATANTGVFSNTAIKQIVIPDRVTIIGGYAFAGVGTLETVTVDDTAKLTTIGAYAFANTGITTINHPDKLGTIGDYAFYNTKLTSAHVPASVAVIGKYAYANTGLASITFDMGGTVPLEIQDYAFANSAFTSVTFPVRTIALGAKQQIPGTSGSSACFLKTAYTLFDGNTNINAINVEEGKGIYASKDGILYIQGVRSPYEDLLYCPVGKTGTVIIPKTVTQVYSRAFYDTSLTAVIFEEFDKTDKNYGKPLLTVSEQSYHGNLSTAAVFHSNTLVSVSFPSHLAVMGTSAIYSGIKYTSLTTVLFNPDSAVEFEDYAMPDNRAITALALPKITDMGRGVFMDCRALTSVTFPEGSTLTAIDDFAFCDCIRLESVIIPKTVRTLGESSFQNAGLKSVVFEEDSMLTAIDSLAFQNTKLESFVFPEGVTFVGDTIFDGCANLREVTISEKMTAVSDTSCTIFGYCPILEKVHVPELNSALVSVDGVVYDLAMTTVMYYPQGKTTDGYVMPETVTRISRHAFRYCSGNTVGLSSNLTQIDNYAFAESQLKSIVLPKSLTTMGAYVFDLCVNLETVLFEQGCELIKAGNRCFNDCTALRSIDLPDNIITLGSYFFADCSSLETVTLPAALTALPSGTFTHCVSLKQINMQEGISAIGSSAFSRSGIGHLVIPSTVTKIDASVFTFCDNLATVEFAPFSQLKSLGNSAFNQSGLVSITLPDSVTTLSSSIFSMCDQLESVTLGASITDIPQSAFNKCTNLTTVILPDGLTTIANSAFVGCTNLQSIVIPANVTTLGNSAFDGCVSLASVTFLGNKITSIGTAVGTNSYTFRNTHALHSIQIPNGVKFIAKNAFENSGLVEITLPSTLEQIGQSAFMGCNNLTAVDIPASTTKIYKQAFSGCEQLKTVNVSFGLESIGDFAFENCGALETINIPATVSEIGANPFVSCFKLSNLVLDPDNANFRYIDGVMYDADMYTLVYYSATNTADTYTIPDSVMQINEGAFSSTRFETFVFPDRFHTIPAYLFKDCKNLSTIVIPKSVETIGGGAFYGCTDLVAIDIPSTVMSMGDYVFANCTALAEVNYEARRVNMTIGKYAFQNCLSITELAIPDMCSSLSTGMFMGSGIVNAVIPESVTDISGNYLFADCVSLISVVMHDNVGTALGQYAFRGCTALTGIRIGESIRSIGAYAFADCTALEEVQLPVNTATFSNYVFKNCSSLKSIYISAPFIYSTTSHMFDGCTSLETVVVQDLRSFMSYGFVGCTSLKSVTAVQTMHNVTCEKNLFEGCTAYAEYHIYRDQIASLGDRMFKGWTPEQTIYIHGFNSYKEVEEFYGVDWLEGCEAQIVVLPE